MPNDRPSKLNQGARRKRLGNRIFYSILIDGDRYSNINSKIYNREFYTTRPQVFDWVILILRHVWYYFQIYLKKL